MYKNNILKIRQDNELYVIMNKNLQIYFVNDFVIDIMKQVLMNNKKEDIFLNMNKTYNKRYPSLYNDIILVIDYLLHNQIIIQEE